MARLTLFIRNLPYSTTDEELATVFGHYGTLKRCFTVKEKSVSDRCRGFGYVTFQERDSADSAVKHVKTVGSRPVQVTYAERRPSTKHGEKSKSHKSLATKDEDESSNSDYEERTDKDSIQLGVKAQRTSPEYAIGRMVVLTGLPEKATAKSIRIRCRKLGPVESIQYPVPGKDSPTALVTYQLHKDARVAVNKLTGKTFRGCTLCAVLLSKETKSVSTKSLKKCRIVVRNLSFKSSEEEVQTIFATYGKVIDVTIPRKPNGHMLGYAFIQFSSFFEAKKAIDAANGTEVKGRVIAVDWLVQRDKYKKGIEEDKKKDQENSEDKEKEGQGASVEEREDEERGDEELESVDEEEIVSIDEEENEDDSNDESDDMKSINSDESFEKPRTKEDVTEGKTLFVRDVAADADDDQLEAIFKQFGHVEYCKAVINPDTGVCKGSAFVKFSDVSSVQACMLAEGDPNTKGLWFDGRRLNISLALSKKELNLMKQKLDDQNAKEAKQDKRNLYLAQEGVIMPGSDSAKEVSKSDMAKRTRSHQERKRKLKNPYFLVSRTRLSVRNLPVSVNESQLKKLFTEHAGKGTIFKQVKILRSKERFTAEGLGRSLGFGFVELADHDTALTALRAINNNPTIFGSEQRPIVEFALEDTRALKLREERKARSQATRGKVTDDKESKSSVKPENKRVEWQLKWKERRLKRKARDKQCQPVQTKTVALGNESARPKTTGSLRHNKVSSHTPVTTKHRPVKSTGVKRGRTDERVYQNAKKKSRQKVARSYGEERAFDDLVKKYKDKLTTNSVADSRWYE